MQPKVINAIKKKGYVVFQQDDKPFNLNIIGVRANDNTPNIFNDRLHLCWKYRGQWTDFNFPITCDPGFYWLKNPLSKLGTAIVKPGQYRGLWKTGLHRGKYFALVQKNEVTVIRDYDKDGELDYDSGREEKGVFGINHHQAGTDSVRVDKWSAGCIVTPNEKMFKIEMDIFREASELWGNSFTFSLIKEKDL